MALQLHNLKPAHGSNKKKKRIGRGPGSGHGTYATRGSKGQRARTGGRGGLILKGLKTNVQSMPKIGGFKSLKPKLAIVNLRDLEKNFAKDDIITTAKLLTRGLIRTAVSGVKVLGEGKLSKPLIVKVTAVSKSAEEAIVKAGGKVVLFSGTQVREKKVVESKDKNIK